MARRLRIEHEIAVCHFDGEEERTTFRSYHWSLVTQSLFYMFLLTAPLNVYGLGTGLFNYRFSRIFLVLTVFAIVIANNLSINFCLLIIFRFNGDNMI